MTGTVPVRRYRRCVALRSGLSAVCLLAATLAPLPDLQAVESSFVRGDANHDGATDIADVVSILEWLFISGGPLPLCLDAIDVDDDGVVNLADPIRVISYLFTSGPPPAPPTGSCGGDPTADTLDCAGPIPSCPLFEPPIASFHFASEAAEDGAGVYLVPQPEPASPDEFAGRRLGMRPLDLALPPSLAAGTIRVESPAPDLTFHLADGTLLPVPFELDESALPATVYVNAGAPSEAIIAVRSLASDAVDELRVRAGPFTGLAGKTLTVTPHFQFVDAFASDGPGVFVGVDPERYSDRAGLPFDIHVVPHRSLLEWGADPALADASGGAETGSVTGVSILDGIVPVWTTALQPGPLVSSGYDVVLDFGQNGILDPGDVVEGLGGDPAFSIVKPLVTVGPYAVTTINYTGGGFLQQRTYYPTDIATLGPLPLVVISHGNGHVYTWYDYLGIHLASHGYVVMSHANDTMPGIETASTTTLTNTEYFFANNATIGGGALAGLIDEDRIAWVGHSRGGEGVCRAYDRIADGVYSPVNFTGQAIRLISSIAPTVFLGPTAANPHDRNWHLIAGGADGDVTGGADCAICQFFRIGQLVTGAVQVTYLHGADHNDFNCCGFEDAVGPSLIGRPAAQNIAKSYYLALVEHYLKGSPATLDFIRRSPLDILPSATLSPYTIATQYEPAPGPSVFVIDDFQEVPFVLAESSEGWPVTYDVTNVHEDLLRELNGTFSWTAADPRNGMTQSGNIAGDIERGVMFDWPNDGTVRSYEYEVPPGEGNWLPWEHLSLRACQGTRHPNTTTLNARLDFTVTLEDGDGHIASIAISPYGTLTKPYARTGLGSGAGWANEFNTVRIRLADFQVGTGLRLDDIRTLRFEFGTGVGSPVGRIGIDDVLLVR